MPGSEPSNPKPRGPAGRGAWWSLGGPQPQSWRDDDRARHELEGLLPSVAESLYAAGQRSIRHTERRRAVVWFVAAGVAWFVVSFLIAQHFQLSGWATWVVTLAGFVFLVPLARLRRREEGYEQLRLLHWLRTARQAGRYPNCPSCDYDQRGTAGNRCPECGTLITFDPGMTPWRPPGAWQEWADPRRLPPEVARKAYEAAQKAARRHGSIWLALATVVLVDGSYQAMHYLEDHHHHGLGSIVWLLGIGIAGASVSWYRRYRWEGLEDWYLAQIWRSHRLPFCPDCGCDMRTREDDQCPVCGASVHVGPIGTKSKES